MFVNLSRQPQQHTGPWIFQIISFEGIYIGSQIWYYFCLRNIHLDSTVALDDDNLVISGCNLIRFDHQFNTKRWGVCLYHKNYLPLIVLSISYLKECLNFELKIGDKPCNFIALYMSPSQSQDDFETSDNFELTLETLAQKSSFLTTIIGDSNAKSSNWYSHDKTSFEGSTIESITSQFGLHQLINKPTHLLQKFFLVYWFNIYITAKYCGQIRCAPIPSSKLSSSNYICWIWFKDLLPTSIFKRSLTL